MTKVEGAADMVLSEVEAEFGKMEVKVGLFKDLVI